MTLLLKLKRDFDRWKANEFIRGTADELKRLGLKEGVDYTVSGRGPSHSQLAPLVAKLPPEAPKAPAPTEQPTKKA